MATLVFPDDMNRMAVHEYLSHATHLFEAVQGEFLKRIRSLHAEQDKIHVIEEPRQIAESLSEHEGSIDQWVEECPRECVKNGGWVECPRDVSRRKQRQHELLVSAGFFDLEPDFEFEVEDGDRIRELMGRDLWTALDCAGTSEG